VKETAKKKNMSALWLWYLSFQGAFWITGGVFAYLDLYTDNFVFRDYKTTKKLIRDSYHHVFWDVVFTCVFWQPLVLFFWCCLWTTSNESFHFLQSVLTIASTGLCYDLGVRGVHRFLHRFGERVHKKHHTLHPVVAIGGLYTHPIELFFLNFGPSSLALLVLNMFGVVHHVYTIAILFVIAGVAVNTAHCGTGSAHSTHHMTCGTPFGTTGLLG